MFGCNGKYNFPEIVFLLTRIYAFNPKMNLRSHFHFNSFPGHSPRIATQREREKRNTKVTKNTERTRAPILNAATESSDPATETSDLATQTSDPATKTSDPATESSEPKTQLPSARVRERTHCSDLPHAGDANFSQTITAQTNTRSSSASRSPVQPLRSPSQTQTHGEFSGTS